MYHGFAPTTSPVVQLFRRCSTKEAGVGDRFRRFEDLWETKWHGALGDPVVDEVEGGQILPERSGLSKSSLIRSLGQLFSRKTTSAEPEKFQLAEGFEDWGIPPYPEDYVDPAEIRNDDDFF